MKVVRLSALRTGRLYPSGNIPDTHLCERLSLPQDHSAAGRIISMQISNDTIRNRTRDLPTCSAVPRPTAPPRTPSRFVARDLTTLSNGKIIASVTGEWMPTEHWWNDIDKG